MRREIGKKISEFIASRGDIYHQLKTKLEIEDSGHDGHITPEKLVKVLCSCIKGISGTEIEKYVKTLDTDQKGRINYQKLILKLENPKNNFPLKALADENKGTISVCSFVFIFKSVLMSDVD